MNPLDLAKARLRLTEGLIQVMNAPHCHAGVESGRAIERRQDRLAARRSAVYGEVLHPKDLPLCDEVVRAPAIEAERRSEITWIERV